MSVKFDMVGLQELKEALRKLPEELAQEAQAIVLEAAETAQRDIQMGYPVRTTGLHPGPKRKSPWFAPGNLRRRVTIQKAFSRFGAVAFVRSNAPHSWLYNFGYTKGRNRRNSKGANRGRMPPPPEGSKFIPHAIRARRRMHERLIELVRRAGFEVAA